MTSRSIGPARRAAALLLLLSAFGCGMPAQAQIYKCVDPNGATLYTDQNGRGCKALDLPSTIPAPPQHRASGPSGAGHPAPAASAPADFPKVNGAQQKARDDDRREILNDELRNEEKKLADLRREFNGGEPERNGNERNYAKYQERVAQLKDNIGRAEKNVDALKREIANIK